MSVFTKLMQARIRLQNTQLKKSGHNKFAGYSYFELGDFLPTIQTIYADMGLCGVVSFGTDLATLTITDTEDQSSLSISSPMSSAALKGCHDVQNLGAVQTYLRRYLWVTAMEIVEHDALDATTGASNEPAKDAKLNAEQIAKIKEKLASVGGDEQKFLKHMGFEKWEDVPARKYGPFMTTIDIKKKASDETVSAKS